MDDDLMPAVDKARRVVESLHADREAMRRFDSRLHGGEIPFDRQAAEAIYTAAIDAAQQTLDTLISAVSRAAELVGPPDAASVQPRADDGS